MFSSVSPNCPDTHVNTRLVIAFSLQRLHLSLLMPKGRHQVSPFQTRIDTAVNKKTTILYRKAYLFLFCFILWDLAALPKSTNGHQRGLWTDPVAFLQAKHMIHTTAVYRLLLQSHHSMCCNKSTSRFTLSTAAQSFCGRTMWSTSTTKPPLQNDQRVYNIGCTLACTLMSANHEL